MALWKHCLLCLSDSSDNIGSLSVGLVLPVPQNYTLYLKMCQYIQCDLLRICKIKSFTLNIPNAGLMVSLRRVLGLIYVIWSWGKKAMNENLNEWKEPKVRSFEPAINQHPPYYSAHCTFLCPTCHFCIFFMYLSDLIIYLAYTGNWYCV